MWRHKYTLIYTKSAVYLRRYDMCLENPWRKIESTFGTAKLLHKDETITFMDAVNGYKKHLLCRQQGCSRITLLLCYYVRL